MILCQQGSTFQLIIVSDGINTYTLFVYSQMTWSTEADSPDIWIGYVAGRESFYTNFLSLTQQALRMDLHAASNGIFISF